MTDEHPCPTPSTTGPDRGPEGRATWLCTVPQDPGPELDATPHRLLPVRVVAGGEPPRGPLSDLTLVVEVTDPELGPVAVRWRRPQVEGTWRWRCTACHQRTRSPDCAHAFAVALHLADQLLGLVTVGVMPAAPIDPSHEGEA